MPSRRQPRRWVSRRAAAGPERVTTRSTSRRSPSAMIFARSINGLSHCEQEYSTPEDLEAGANVLLRAALRLAGIEGERTSHKRG